MRKKLLKKLVMIFFILILSLMMFNDNVSAGWFQMDSGTISDASLYGVWGSSPTDVFVVGYYYDSVDGIFKRIILHYDGSTWSEMESGNINFTALWGVWGSSATDVFAVGELYDPSTRDIVESTILHYDGSTWSQMDSGTMSDTIFEGVWGSSPTDVFAVGYYHDFTNDTYTGTILHCGGSTWSQMDSSVLSDTPLYGVWGSSATDVFAVGEYYNPDDWIYSSAILHYDGSTWSQMDSGALSDVVLCGVWGSSATDVFAVGYYFFSSLFGVELKSVILHYDGSSWSQVDSVTMDNTLLYGVWGSSATDVFAVGFYYDFTNGTYTGTILHYDGGTWSEIDNVPISDLSLYGVWGSSATDVFAVGDYYNATDGIYTSAILHYEPCPTEEIYGEHSKETELLRKFRDNVLSKTPESKELIRLYYEWSPAIVKAMKEDGTFKNQVREMVDGVLSLIEGEVE